MSHPVPMSTMAAAGTPGAAPLIAKVAAIDMPWWAATITAVYMTALFGFLIYDRLAKPWIARRRIRRSGA